MLMQSWVYNQVRDELGKEAVEADRAAQVMLEEEV